MVLAPSILSIPHYIPGPRPIPGLGPALSGRCYGLPAFPGERRRQDRTGYYYGMTPAHFPESLQATLTNFADSRQEWRRLIAEFVGTFFLVLAAAGGPMMAVAYPGSVGQAAAAAAPGLMVMAIIMAMGRVSGAHLNPAVTLAFALRRDFPWRRIPGYWVAQLLGAASAGIFLQAVLDVSAAHGSTYPATPASTGGAFWLEMVLTFGLVTVILGTASGAQNIGIVGAIGVGAYIALAGLWGSPLSGASMNPARTFGPDVAALDFTAYWVYVLGPLAGGVLAVGVSWLLRGPAGGRTGSLAAQGAISPEVRFPDRR